MVKEIPPRWVKYSDDDYHLIWGHRIAAFAHLSENAVSIEGLYDHLPLPHSLSPIAFLEKMYRLNPLDLHVTKDGTPAPPGWRSAIKHRADTAARVPPIDEAAAYITQAIAAYDALPPHVRAEPRSPSARQQLEDTLSVLGTDHPNRLGTAIANLSDAAQILYSAGPTLGPQKPLGHPVAQFAERALVGLEEMTRSQQQPHRPDGLSQESPERDIDDLENDNVRER